MKQNFLSKILAAGLALVAITVVVAPTATQAATWNDVFGQGNPNDDLLIGGTGVPLAVIPSVQSNSIYYVTSAKSSGAPVINRVVLQNDFVSGTVRYYVATNTWTCASNQPAGTNIIWLTTTNNMMSTNDVLVFRSVNTDCYQLMLVSGNATDAFGSVYSNSLGQVAFKTFNTPTNPIVAGDKIYKMSLQQSFTPLAMGVVTNQLAAIPAVHFGDWVTLGEKLNPVKFSGRVGVPSAIVMTYSNAADIQIDGQYYRPWR